MSKDKVSTAEAEVEKRYPLQGEQNDQKWLTYHRWHMLFVEGAEWKKEQYGNIDPAAVKEMYEALVGLVGWATSAYADLNSPQSKPPASHPLSKAHAALSKATIK